MCEDHMLLLTLILVLSLLHVKQHDETRTRVVHISKVHERKMCVQDVKRIHTYPM